MQSAVASPLQRRRTGELRSSSLPGVGGGAYGVGGVGSQAVADGYGHILHRFAVRGDVAFTTFYTTRAFMDANTDVCQTLVKGIGQALDRMYAMPIADLAAKVSPYFPDLDVKVLAAAIDGYRAAGLWARKTSLPPTAVVRLKAALLSGGFIQRDMPYDDIARDIQD